MAQLKPRLEVRAAIDGGETPEPGWSIMRLQDIVRDLKRGRNILGYAKARLVADNPHAVANPVRTGLALLLLSPFGAEIVSEDRRVRRTVTPASVLRDLAKALTSRGDVERGRRAALAWLNANPVKPDGFDPPEGPPLVLRTTLWFGAKVGGAFSHASGVINALYDSYGALDLVSTDVLPGIRDGIALHEIDLAAVRGWSSGDGLYLAANPGLYAQVLRTAPPAAPAFVYQRSALGDLSGLRFARARRRPLVLEYNGPEVWVANKWGSGLGYSKEYEHIECELLRRADLVLAVSAQLVEEAIARGADPERILLSPNAADPDHFRPDLCGIEARARLGMEGRTLAMLVSSFGPWHGVETAIEALAQVKRRRPDITGRSCLVLVGHGSAYQTARELSARLGLEEGCEILFTSSIPAREAPGMLAAADLLLSPQVENPDGSAFFGSPTKLFEYMAMGKPIIASALAQIGEILEHEHTALLVSPGDVEALSAALERGLEAPQRYAHLGAAARHELERSHTWAHRIGELHDALVRIGAFKE